VDHGAVVQGLKAGDEEAQKAFAEEFGPLLRRFLMGLGLSHVDAEDIAVACVEDIMMVKIRRFEYRGGHSFVSWCLTVARNERVNWSRGRRAHPTTTLEEVSQRAAPGPSRGMNPELAKAVQDALAALSEPDEVVVVLRALVPNNSFAEIGQALLVSQGAARVRYHRTLKRLDGLLRPIPCVQEWLLSISQRRTET